MILLDTSGVLAALDQDEAAHGDAGAALKGADPRVLSPFVLAELDYLLARRVGTRAELAFLADVASGAYRLESFTAEDVQSAIDIIMRYRSLGLGLADASIMVLAERHDCSDVLTLDDRHFRAVTRAGGAPFRLLPADIVS